MKLHELARIGTDEELPTSIELDDCAGSHERLQVREWLRATPIHHDALALWQGRNVLARLLTGPDAGLSLEREKAGMNQLAAQGLPRLVPLKEGRTPTSGAWMLYEAAEDLQSLGAAWASLASQPPLTDAQQSLIGEALGALGGLHGKGFWPADPEFRHFIRQQGQVGLIDAGALCRETPGTPLGQGKVLENLGLFFAQLPASFEPWFEELLVFYLLANGEHALPLEALLKKVAAARERRMRQHLPQLERDSPVCHVTRDAGLRRAVLRSEQARLRAILADAHAALRDGSPCPAGGDVLAVRLQTSAEPVRMIRYPAPTGLRRLLASPAWRAWLDGQRRYLLGETTRRPLAVLEHRRFGLRGMSYLITESEA